MRVYVIYINTYIHIHTQVITIPPVRALPRVLIYTDDARRDMNVVRSRLNIGTFFVEPSMYVLSNIVENWNEDQKEVYSALVGKFKEYLQNKSHEDAVDNDHLRELFGMFFVLCLL